MTDAARTAHLCAMEAHLRSCIIGQEHVLGRMAETFARGELGVASPDHPRGSFLLAGPTGTGQTETFTCAIHYAFGSSHLTVFDLSEYQDASAVGKLIGASSTDRGLLGRALGAESTGGILFDEIEKAHPSVMDLFLQILWHGRVTLATGEVLSFKNHYIGFTSNIGGTEAMRMAQSRFASVEQAVQRRLAQALRPELIGRIGDVLIFAPLSPDTQRKICGQMVETEISRLRALGYDLETSPEINEFLVREGFHPQLGARPLRKAVERHLQNAVVNALFATGIGHGRLVCEAGALRIGTPLATAA
jgi:ATP-dependent Clp protease ATP-binding subunit ClpA